jgi:hypothetical protein
MRGSSASKRVRFLPTAALGFAPWRLFVIKNRFLFKFRHFKSDSKSIIKIKHQYNPQLIENSIE